MPKVRPLTEEGRWAEHEERVAEQCILAMRKNKVSQTDLANFLHVSGPAISMQLGGVNKLSLDTVLAVIYLTGEEPNKIMNLRR